MIRLARCIVVSLCAFSAFGAEFDYLDWIHGPEAVFAMPQEREAFKSVLSKPQFDAFIAEFWAKRGEAFHQELNRRIAFANKQFAVAGRLGSQTERGRVWIILGSPNNERMDRTQQSGTFESLDQQAVVVRRWTYKSDRLAKELGLPELIVIFQTDMRKGYETIENPGLVEPYLTKAAQRLQESFKTAPAAPAPAAAAPAEDPVWSAPLELNGAIFSGESYISATEKPFYAIDFYLPKSGFPDVAKVTVVGAIRDANGKQVKALRRPSEAVTYDASGDRFVDASFELPAGRYSGAFALESAGGKLIASTKTDFDVIPRDFIGLSRPFMTSRIDTFEKQLPFDPFTFLAMKYVIKADRRFRSNEKIAYFAAVSNPTVNPEPSMMLKMKISKDGTPFASTPLNPVSLMQTGPHTYLLANQFDADNFKPGHYRLEMLLRDMNAPKASDAYTRGYVANLEFDVLP